LLLLLGSCTGTQSFRPDPGSLPDDDDPFVERYTMQGLVLTLDETPLTGVEVLLGSATARTDDTGRFTFDTVVPGTYPIALQDAEGNYDCQLIELGTGGSSFTFYLPTRRTGLRVLSVAPVLNSNGAALDGGIELVFSTAVNHGNITSSDFTFTPHVGELEIEALADDHLLIRPQLQLPVNQRITCELTGEISSSSGEPLAHPVHLRFRTAQTDTYPPRLVNTTPEPQSTGFAPNLGVRFSFSEELAPLGEDTIIVTNPPVEFSAYTTNRDAVIHPEDGWRKNATYEVQLAGISDPAGNASTEPYSVRFTTGEEAAPRNHIQPEWNQLTDSIFFAADPAGSYDLFRINPDSTGFEQLTFLDGDELNPTVSQDGTLLAFQHRPPGGSWSIYIADLSVPGEPLKLTSDDFNDTDPYFSRTISNTIVFVSDSTDPQSLYRMNSDGSALVELDPGFGSRQWQPILHPLLDNQLLFTSSGGGNSDIWRKSISAVDGEAINNNLTSDFLSDEHSPAWGYDASFVVFVSDASGTDNLWYAEASGEFPRQVTYLETDLATPCVAPFSGDFRCVASVANTNRGSDLVLIDLISGELAANLTGGADGS
jgi:Tol biopolymer transport system component